MCEMSLEDNKTFILSIDSAYRVLELTMEILTMLLLKSPQYTGIFNNTVQYHSQSQSL